LGLSAAQQGDQQSTPQPAANSLAEASRHAREQKKDQAKAVHVWNDDNLPKTEGVNVVGQTSVAENASGGTTAVTGGANPTAAPAPSAENLAAVTAELTTAKEHLQSLQTDLNILQRKYGLDEQMYLSKPEYKNDREGAAQLKNEQTQIAALQAEVVEAQKKVDLLQSKLSGSGAAGSSK
jgi:uncharacterized protein (DUF342 family)